ncbi:hypothetical protein [Fodinibius halophilus]|nr:hypothetical protein [Fodinibius halophilus]
MSSLIVGSLPVTGFMIWWGRRKKVMHQSRRNGKQKEKSKLVNAA